MEVEVFQETREIHAKGPTNTIDRVEQLILTNIKIIVLSMEMH